MSNNFPQGWFYIVSPDRQDQVLTVSNMTMQPSTRVELRPNKQSNHQLWCYHQGYLVNKHSGCVLGVEREKMNGQYIFQSKKSGLASDQKKQKWKYDNQQWLILTDDNDKEYALNNLAVPKVELVKKEQNQSGWLLVISVLNNHAAADK